MSLLSIFSSPLDTKLTTSFSKYKPVYQTSDDANFNRLNLKNNLTDKYTINRVKTERSPNDTAKKSSSSQEDYLELSQLCSVPKTVKLTPFQANKSANRNIESGTANLTRVTKAPKSPRLLQTPCGLVQRTTVIRWALFIILLIAIAVILIWTHAGKPFKAKPVRRYLPPSSSELASRRAFVRNMAKSAFSAYRQFAWGFPQLAPLSRTAALNDGNPLPAVTLLNSMSSLWVMGLEEEWQAASDWILAGHLINSLQSLNKSVVVSDTIDVALGGLLSAYALSGKGEFLEQATQVYSRLPEDLFHTYPPGYLPKYFNPAQRKLIFPDEKINPFSITVEYQPPELIYLANLTQMAPGEQIGDQIGRWLAASKYDLLAASERRKSAFYSKVKGSSVANYTWRELDHTFYRHLVSAWWQLGAWDSELLGRLDQAVASALQMSQLVTVTGKSGDQLLYVRDFDTSEMLFKDAMNEYACNLGGLFALTSLAHDRRSTELSKPFKHLPSDKLATFYRQLAVSVTATCHAEAESTKTQLLPYAFWRGKIVSGGAPVDTYLAEAYFYLYRLTGDERYRAWAWDLAQAISRNCRTPSGGFTSLKLANTLPSVKDNSQPVYFLSGTLKYLYLTFADKSDYPLDRWIFTSQGHLLPICGTHERYTAEMCK